MANEQKEKLSPILQDMQKIGLHMGLMGKGEDYLLEIDAPPEAVDIYMEAHARALAKAAAQRLGLEDETALLYAKDRTPEQSEMMLQMGAEAQARRLKKYINSNYFASFGLCLDAMAAALKVGRESAIYEHEDACQVCTLINRYFYAQHKDIEPEAPAALDDQSKAEIRALVAEIVAFQKAHGGTLEGGFVECFKLKEGKELEKLTEISRADFFGLPLSKAWRQQHAIAAEGAAGRELNVGNKTLSGAVIVKASISDREGKPLDINEVQKGVQRAIADLIYEAGGKKALPINVSPAQIYRAYARLPFDAMVTAQQEAEMEAAMDVLMYAPSRVDFTAQLQKHKHIEKQADYDYEGEAAGKLEGNLIQAQKMEGTTKNGARVVAYKIYDVPVYYMYSHAVGQIAWLPNALLTGSTKPATKPAKTEAQEGVQYVAIKTNMLTRIMRMKERKKARETYIKVIRAAEVAEDCEIELTRQKERTLLKNMALYLDELKAQKQIKGYEETKQGRKIAGYSIIL